MGKGNGTTVSAVGMLGRGLWSHTAPRTQSKRYELARHGDGARDLFLTRAFWATLALAGRLAGRLARLLLFPALLCHTIACLPGSQSGRFLRGEDLRGVDDADFFFFRGVEGDEGEDFFLGF